MKPVNVFIGYDRRQPVAFQVAAHSVWQHASCPVNITRLDLSKLPMTRRGLTEFTYSRFLVPYLSDFDGGVSIFLDSDVLVRGDVAELLAYPLMLEIANVHVVFHEKRFERPSVMVFQNKWNTILTPDYCADKRHALMPLDWASDIGELPKEWNHLVGYDAPNPDAKLVHFTGGIPIWPETKGCEFSDEWHAAAKQSMSSVSFDALMGASVHVKHMKVGA